MANQPLSILRRKAVEARVGLSRTTLYQYIRDGRFPRPIRVGTRAVGWLEGDVTAWLADRVERSRESVPELSK